MNNQRPLLLMISGWAFPPSAWAPAAAALEDTAELRVLHPCELLRSPNIAKALAGHLGEGRPAFLGGWSLGGMLALEQAPGLAAQVRGLMLIASTPRFCTDAQQPWGADPVEVRAMRTNLQRDPEAVLSAFYQRTAHPYAADGNALRAWLRESIGHVGDLVAGLTHLIDADLRSGTSLRGIPVSLLHGRQDAVIPFSASRSLAVDLMPSRLEIVPDAGHDLPLRRLDLLRAAVKRLLAMSP